MVTKQTPILKHRPCMAFKMETSILVSIAVVPWLFQQVSAKYLVYFVRILSNAWWEIGKPKVATKHTYFYLQESNKWGKRIGITTWDRPSPWMYCSIQN